MNEEELKKGCGVGFWYRDIQFVYCGYKLFLCPTCQARLEGFQKGKLEERERIRELVNNSLDDFYCMSKNKDANTEVKRLRKIIEQLQKEIGGESK